MKAFSAVSPGHHTAPEVPREGQGFTCTQLAVCSLKGRGDGEKGVNAGSARSK